MDITKDKVKRASISSALVVGFSEYIGASVTNDFNLVKDYRFSEFWESFNYNMAHPITTMTNAFSNELFHQIQPFIIGGSLLLAAKILFTKNKTYEDASDYGAYGTARWAKDCEIFKSRDLTTNMKYEGPILARHKGKPIILKEDSFLNKNISLIGGSGAGKTRGHIIPNILKNQEKSMVITDPKGELYESTSQIKREQGYEVRLVNFKNRDISDRYNLFEYIRKDSDCFKVADTIAQNASEGSKVSKDFFNEKAKSVLQALILYVKYAMPIEQRHMGSVLKMGGVDPEGLEGLFRQFPQGHIVRNAYESSIEQLKEKTFSDVFSTLTNILNPWLYRDVCEFTAANDFLFEELGQKKMILYIILPIADNDFKPLITTFFSQMFSELYHLADQNYGELPRHVFLGLDEFANIGKIPNFPELHSTTRSYGIDTTIILQNNSQLVKIYGKDAAKEVLNNCDINLLLKANEEETAKYFSNLAGKTTIKVKNNSNSTSNKSSTKNESVNYMGRDLITSDEIRRLSQNEQLVFVAGQYPMKINKSWFDKFKYFTKMLGKKVSRDEYPMEERTEYQTFTLPSNEEMLIDDTEELPSYDEETGEILDDLQTEKESDSVEEEKEKKGSDAVDDMMKDFTF